MRRDRVLVPLKVEAWLRADLRKCIESETVGWEAVLRRRLAIGDGFPATSAVFLALTGCHPSLCACWLAAEKRAHGNQLSQVYAEMWHI